MEKSLQDVLICHKRGTSSIEYNENTPMYMKYIDFFVVKKMKKFSLKISIFF